MTKARLQSYLKFGAGHAAGYALIGLGLYTMQQGGNDGLEWVLTGLGIIGVRAKQERA